MASSRPPIPLLAIGTAAGVCLAVAWRRRRQRKTNAIRVKAHPQGWWCAGCYEPVCMEVKGVSFSMMLDPALPIECIDMLRHDLGIVASSLPPQAAHAVAQACHIYVNLDNGRRGAEVHWCPKQFVQTLGSFLAVSGCKTRDCAVEINRWSDYGAFLLKREGILLHELSHVYNATLGRDDAGIMAMYEVAKDSGMYERVAKVDGTEAKAYGLSNHLEFFASLSVAMLGGHNDYFPFTRSDLRAFDPASFGAMLAIWARHGDNVAAWGKRSPA